MQTLLTIVAVIAALVAGFLYWQFQAHAPYTTIPPVAEIESGIAITSITFPRQIDADGEAVGGTIGFRAATGNIVYADFQVVEAGFFIPFGFDPEIRETPSGQFEFYIATLIPQQVTLRVTLSDDVGQTSEPVEFSFTAVPSQPTTDNQPGGGN